LLLTHFIGRGLIEYGAKDLAIDTKGYRRLMRILSTVENDTWQLFLDMNRYNRFAQKSREDFLTALIKLDRKVKGS
jgi:prephenate dehydrogenase